MSSKGEQKEEQEEGRAVVERTGSSFDDEHIEAAEGTSTNNNPNPTGLLKTKPTGSPSSLDASARGLPASGVIVGRNNPTAVINAAADFYTSVVDELRKLEEICTGSLQAKKLSSLRTQVSEWISAFDVEVKRLRGLKLMTPVGGSEELLDSPSSVSPTGSTSGILSLDSVAELIRPPPVTLSALADFIQTNTFGIPLETMKLRTVALDILIMLLPRCMYVLCTLAPVLLLRGRDTCRLPLPEITSTLEDAIGACSLITSLFCAQLNPSATNAASSGSQHLHNDTTIRAVLRECTDSIKSFAKFSLLMQAAVRKSFRVADRETQKLEEGRETVDTLKDEDVMYERALRVGVHITEKVQSLVRWPLNYMLDIVGSPTHVGAIVMRTRTDTKTIAFQLFEVLAKQTLDFLPSDAPSQLTEETKEFCETFPPLIFVLLAQLAARCGDSSEAELLAVKLLSDSLSAIACEDQTSFRHLFSVPRFCKPILEGCVLCLLSVHPPVLGAGLSMLESTIKTATLEAAQEAGFVYCNCLMRLLDSENSSPDNKITILNHFLRVIVPELTSVESLSGVTSSSGVKSAPKPPLVLQLYWLFDLNPRLHSINFLEMMTTSLSRIVRCGSDGLTLDPVTTSVPDSSTYLEHGLSFTALNALVTLVETVAQALQEYYHWKRKAKVSSDFAAECYERVTSTRTDKVNQQRAVDIVNVTPVKGILKLFEVSADMKGATEPEKELSSEQYVAYQATVQKVVDFLLFTPSLNPGSIGEFVGDPSPFCVSVCKQFMATLPLKGKLLTEGISEMLSVMQLPKEGQRIERVLEQFSSAMFHANSLVPTFPFKTEDATFIVAVATVMLNTDLHNPRVSSKMDLTSFLAMTRGCNDGDDLPPSYAEEIFRRIQSQPLTNVKGFGAANVESSAHISTALAPQGKMDLLFFSRDERKELMFGLERQRIVSETKELITRRSLILSDDWPSIEALSREFFNRTWPSLLAVFSVAMQLNHVAVSVQKKCIRGLECTLLAATTLNLQTEAEATMSALLRMGTYKSVNAECVKAVLHVAACESARHFPAASWGHVVNLLAEGRRGVLDIATESEELYAALGNNAELDGGKGLVHVISAVLHALGEVSKHDAGAISAVLYVLGRCVQTYFQCKHVTAQDINSLWKETINPKVLEVARLQADSNECVTLLIERLFQLLSTGYVRVAQLQRYPCLAADLSVPASPVTPASPSADTEPASSEKDEEVENPGSPPTEASKAELSTSQRPDATDGSIEPPPDVSTNTSTTIGPTSPKASKYVAARPFFVLVQLQQANFGTPNVRLQLLAQLQTFLRQGLAVLSQTTTHTSPSAQKSEQDRLTELTMTTHPLILGFTDVVLWRYLCQVLVLGLCEPKIESIPPFAALVSRYMLHLRFPYILGVSTDGGMATGQDTAGASPATQHMRSAAMTMVTTEVVLKQKLAAYADRVFNAVAPHSSHQADACDSEEEEEAFRAVDQLVCHLFFASSFARDPMVSQRAVSSLSVLAQYFVSHSGHHGSDPHSVSDVLQTDVHRRMLVRVLIRCLMEALRVDSEPLRRKVMEELRVVSEQTYGVPALVLYFMELSCDMAKQIAMSNNSSSGATSGSNHHHHPHHHQVKTQQQHRLTGLETSFKALSFDRVPKVLHYATPHSLLNIFPDLMDLLTAKMKATATSEEEVEDNVRFVLRECVVPIAIDEGCSAATRGLAARAFVKCAHECHSPEAQAVCYEALREILLSIVIPLPLFSPHLEGEGVAKKRGSASALGESTCSDHGESRAEHSHSKGECDGEESTQHRTADDGMPLCSLFSRYPSVAIENAPTYAPPGTLADMVLTLSVVLTAVAVAPVERCGFMLVPQQERAASFHLRKDTQQPADQSGHHHRHHQHETPDGGTSSTSVLQLWMHCVRVCLTLLTASDLFASTAFKQLRTKAGFLSPSSLMRKALIAHNKMLCAALTAVNTTKGEEASPPQPLQELYRNVSAELFNLFELACSGSVGGGGGGSGHHSSNSTVNALTVSSSALQQELSTVVVHWCDDVVGALLDEHKEGEEGGEASSLVWQVASSPEVFKDLVKSLSWGPESVASPAHVAAVQRYLFAFHERVLKK